MLLHYANEDLLFLLPFSPAPYSDLPEYVMKFASTGKAAPQQSQRVGP
ncbi:hypothetical protein QPR87_19745 [Paracoccus sp. SSJ]|nr:hypothetical protein [Paracoccus sp. SSJ]